MRQVLNIGLDAPKNPTIRRRWLTAYRTPAEQIAGCRRALYTLGFITADLERHGNTLVVKLRRPINDTWLYWVCNQVHQDCIAVVRERTQEHYTAWCGYLVGPARDEYEPFKPAEFIGLPEDF